VIPPATSRGPLLSPVAGTFGGSHGSATLVLTLTQFAYALGLLTLLPLGDMPENRALVELTPMRTEMARNMPKQDPAVQSHQSLSLRDTCSPRENVRARVSSLCMTFVFAGGAMATALSGTVNDTHGRKGICLLGAPLALPALLVSADSLLRPPPGRTGAPSTCGSAASAPEGAESAARVTA
jgi:predicted MFS family arabinose efflux permease